MNPDDDRIGYYVDDAGILRPGTGIQPSYLAPGPHNLPPQNRARVGGPGAPGYTPITDVREINRYPSNLITLGFSLTVASILAVTAPATTRILLMIRNSEGSAGVLYIGFGGTASDGTSPVSLAAGNVFVADYVVFQGDIFLAAATTANCVLSYADVPT